MPGRLRIQVAGLRRRPSFGTYIESRLTADDAIRVVRASAVTGNVLILFDPKRRSVQRLVAELARIAADGQRGEGRPARRDEGDWHALEPAAVIARLGADPARGLSTVDASARLRNFGANRLPVPEPKSPLAIVAGHLTSLPVTLLGGAALLSLAGGALVDAGVILAVIAANTAVGYFTERRVERILASLQTATVAPAIVRRDGREAEVAASALTPGDTIVLKAGHDVPADARVIEGLGLAVDESALTGESGARLKSASTRCPRDAPVADRLNMVYAGTVIAQGAGIAVVTGTGHDTEIGRVRTLVARAGTPPTALERQLDRAGRRLVGVSLAFCAATLALGVARGVPLLEMTRTAISLAVAAVPEGLPAVATTTLALGMQRMLRRRMVVRRLAAVESLGATTVICADKTGTLTENRMSVHSWRLVNREYHQSEIVAALVDGRVSAGASPDPALARGLAIAVLCNEAEVNGASSDGSSTEIALLVAALEAGLDYRSLRQRRPAVQTRRRLDGENWMGTVHEEAPSGYFTAVKGAPEEVIARATRWLDGEAERPLTADVRRSIVQANAELAARGMRVLGLAFREAPPESGDPFSGLVWVGLVALRDPIRAGVREAIAACRRAGIRTVILTGDQADTAAAISRELGHVENGQPRVLIASQLARVDQPTLHRLTREIDVFARVSPAHKYQIVRALQAGGEIVAMTGDGINDAAALRAADIGVAMGARGTDVARDVADVVLLDDDFHAIVAAVEQGRTIHANISKALSFLLATNLSEILVTLGALAFGAVRPMSPLQFLWINLLSDVAPALALAVEPPEPDVMDRPPRDPAAPILSRSALASVAQDAAVLAAATLGVHGVALARYGAGARATTLAFSTLTSAQLIHASSCRAGSLSASLVGVVGGTLAVQTAALTAPPLRRLLGLAPLSLSDCAVVAAGAVGPWLLREMRRASVARKRPARIIEDSSRRRRL